MSFCGVDIALQETLAAIGRQVKDFGGGIVPVCGALPGVFAFFFELIYLVLQCLAEHVHMSVVTIAHIETGKRWVRLSTLDKIARALKVRVADLFSSL